MKHTAGNHLSFSRVNYIVAQQSGLLFESQPAEVTLNVFRSPERSVGNTRVGIGDAIPLERRALEFQLARAKHPRTETN